MTSEKPRIPDEETSKRLLDNVRKACDGVQDCNDRLDILIAKFDEHIAQQHQLMDAYRHQRRNQKNHEYPADPDEN